MDNANGYRLSQQLKAQRQEHEAFHALMNLIPDALQKEAIALWVKGTEAASAEAFNRRALEAELSEAEYKEAQAVVFEAWKELIKG